MEEPNDVEILPVFPDAPSDPLKQRIERFYADRSTVVEIPLDPADVPSYSGRAYDRVVIVAVRCTQSVAACINDKMGACTAMYGQQSTTVYLHRLSGVVYACAIAALCRCWLMRSTTVVSALAAAVTTLSMIVLNTGSAHSLYASEGNQTRQIRLIIAICYLVMFMQWACAAWPENGVLNTCIQRCCQWVELGYGVTVVCISTIMFFAESTFDALWVAYQQPDGVYIQSTLAASLSVLSMFLLVLGGSLEILAMHESRMAGISTMPYLFGALASRVVYVPDSDTSPSLRMWGRFFPAWTYTVGILAPIVMWDAHELQLSAMILALSSNVCVLVGGRLLLASSHPETNNHTSKFIY